jgi:tetratricopeptide (TPR) repeat protein
MADNPNTPVFVHAETGDIFRFARERQSEKRRSQRIGQVGAFISDERSHADEEPGLWPLAVRSEIGLFAYDRHAVTAELRRLRAERPRSARSWATSGMLRTALSEWDEAIGDVDEAIKKAPGASLWHYYRGVLRLAIRDLDRALEDLTMAPEESSEALKLHSLLVRSKNERLDLREMPNELRVDVPTSNGRFPFQLWVGPVRTSRPDVANRPQP